MRLRFFSLVKEPKLVVDPDAEKLNQTFFCPGPIAIEFNCYDNMVILGLNHKYFIIDVSNYTMFLINMQYICNIQVYLIRASTVDIINGKCGYHCRCSLYISLSPSS